MTSDCTNSCLALPAGATGDQSGDSIACRTYHAGAAASDPLTHCQHAGPTGGDTVASSTSTGPCGSGCEAFCKIALTVCTGANAVYRGDATTNPVTSPYDECFADCISNTSGTDPYSTADTATNDFGCRMYHLTVAARDAASAATHCPHITDGTIADGGTSAVCTQ